MTTPSTRRASPDAELATFSRAARPRVTRSKDFESLSATISDNQSHLACWPLAISAKESSRMTPRSRPMRTWTSSRDLMAVTVEGEIFKRAAVSRVGTPPAVKAATRSTTAGGIDVRLLYFPRCLGGGGGGGFGG